MQPYLPPPSTNSVIVITREHNPDRHWVQFFQTFPEFYLPAVTAQAGPAKPRLPLDPKPTDPQPVPPSPPPTVGQHQSRSAGIRS
jgi:hypothetical protein